VRDDDPSFQEAIPNDHLPFNQAILGAGSKEGESKARVKMALSDVNQPHGINTVLMNRFDPELIGALRVVNYFKSSRVKTTFSASKIASHEPCWSYKSDWVDYGRCFPLICRANFCQIHLLKFGMMSRSLKFASFGGKECEEFDISTNLRRAL
jgi:hypothetical protein